MTHPEGSDSINPQCTDDMVQAFWNSKPRSFREKWATRMRSGLSPKRKFQIIRMMTEYFARQKGPMEDVAKAKRAEFQTQLDKVERDIKQFENMLGNARISREQLKGAIEGIDLIFKAAAGPQKPALSLVPPLPEVPKLNLTEPTTPTPPAPPSPENL